MIEPSDRVAPMGVLVIGAGERVQNNFLPVLTLLARSNSVRVVGVHSRTAERLFPVTERWNVPAVTHLESVDFDAVDVVAISVPPAQNGPVLESLLPYATGLSIVIDTPVAWGWRELAITAQLLSKFRRVLVAEDYMNFPPFALMRRAVMGGLIGNVGGVTLNNVGYLYHGLALIRSFCGFERARYTWSRRVGTLGEVTGYTFKGGFRAMVVGPYRSHRTGGITIEGSKGILTDFASDEAFANPGSSPIYVMNYERSQDGAIRHISLNEAGKEASTHYAMDLPELIAMQAMDFPDKSDLNMLRGCGLLNIFQAFREPGNINNFYGPANAFYDSFASRLAQRGWLPMDPLVWFGSDCVALLRTLARFG